MRHPTLAPAEVGTAINSPNPGFQWRWHDWRSNTTSSFSRSRSVGLLWVQVKTDSRAETENETRYLGTVSNEVLLSDSVGAWSSGYLLGNTNMHWPQPRVVLRSAQYKSFHLNAISTSHKFTSSLASFDRNRKIIYLWCIYCSNMRVLVFRYFT